MLCFVFIFIKVFLQFSFDFSLTKWLFNNVSCIVHILVNFPVFFLLSISGFILLWSERLLCIILIFLSQVGLKRITTNKASGGDGIPVELFQFLKDDAVKVLHSICQHIWKTQQWPQDWKRSVFIPIPKKDNTKECSNYHTIALISHASTVMLKILQARLQQYVNCELPDVQDGFRKGRGTRDQILNICQFTEKAREKHLLLLY